MINATGWNSMVADLRAIKGGDFQPILLDQAGQLLKLCIKYTPAASAAKIRQQVKTKNSRVDQKGGAKLTKNVRPGSANNVWLIDDSTWDRCNWPKTKDKYSIEGSLTKPQKIIDGRTLHLISSNRHWSVTRWARYKAMEALLESNKTDEKKAVKSRGLTKQTWLQIADALGINISDDVPQYVKGANTFKGNAAPTVGTAVQTTEAASFYVDISNASKILTGSNVDGAAILQRAMNARAKAFQFDLERGVFENIAQRAKRYPGIFTT